MTAVDPIELLVVNVQISSPTDRLKPCWREFIVYSTGDARIYFTTAEQPQLYVRAMLQDQ